jgi:hypothetical protein|tara:strand:- start:1689 stop:1979 length:291 start_codon:yes stop_codon:yes gene_type:complete
MKKAIYFISLLLLTSCTEDSVTEQESTTTGDYKVTIVEFDGCEYVNFKKNWSASSSVTHKGNCKNHNYLDGRSFNDKIDAIREESGLIDNLLKKMD